MNRIFGIYCPMNDSLKALMFAGTAYMAELIGLKCKDVVFGKGIYLSGI